MSISTKNTDPADREFADVVFAPNPEKEEKPTEKAEVTPAKEEKPTTPPAKEEKPATDTPATEKKEEKEEKTDSKAEQKAEETPKKEEEEKKESSEKSKSDKKEEKPSKESAPKEEAPVAKAETPTPSKKENSTLMDAILLGVLALLIAGGGFFIYNQMEMYNVPSPYEQAKAEYDRLKAELETLRGGKDKGNTRVTKSVGLINELKNTENAIKDAQVALKREKEALSKLEAEIARTKEGIDAALYNLRTTDKDCRAKALSELSGLPIGDAVHKRKADAMQGAIIYRVDTAKKTITFRSPTGQVTWAMKDIVTKDFPIIARYALELEDLVDMTILNTIGNGGEKAPKRPVAKRTAKPRPAAEDADYDPTPGAPVINSKPGESISTEGPVVDPTEPATTPTWDAPTGDLPI